MAVDGPPLPFRADSERVNRPRTAVHRARRIHRCLGVVIGAQFLLWTAGGLYFSWTDLDAVHGDHLLRPAPTVPADAPLVSVAPALSSLRSRTNVRSITSIDVAMVVGAPTYRVAYVEDSAGVAVPRRLLVDAVSGEVRPPLSHDEALEVARAAYTGTSPMRNVAYLAAGAAGSHHEYREQPLPAWAVRFGDSEGATVYVPSEFGQVHRVRNNRWRRFDALWMLHTMDYQGRDDFNNLVLRAFSLLGLVTVLSGFVLFGLTTGWARGRRGRRVAAAHAVGSSNAG